MSIETFDWQGYMSDIGYAPEQIPNEINDEDREWLYGLWARDLMEQINYEVRHDPYLSTAKEKRAEARRQFLQYAPDLAHFFGEEVQPNDPNSTYDPEAFRDHVINNEIQNANLGYYLDTFAASRINEDTDVKYPWLKGLTKDQFKKHFMEQQDIDEALTSVDDIRNGNFGTLAANYQAQLAQQQGLRGDEKSGHMAALKQGWYEFEKLFGYTVGTLGDATGVQWLSDIGNEIAQNVIQKSDAYNYQSKYNESLADTIKNQGFMAVGGKILNMAEENWATTAAPLALAGIGKILSTYAHVPQPLADAATRAVAANVVRRQGANLLRRASQLAYASSVALSGLEIGGVRAELEEHGKYDPNNVADVVAAGLVSSSLDFIGNVAAFKGIGITASRLWQSKLAVMEAQNRLAKEIAENQAKSFTHRVLSAALVEGVTEGLQEIPAMMVGSRRGIDYTSKEVRDRIIDAAAVGVAFGGSIRMGEIALEKYHRGDGEDTPTPTASEEEPGETPEAAPPQGPSEPPLPGFEGAIPLIVAWRQMDKGFSVYDEFNVGYGETKEEAAQNFIDNANKGRVDINPNDITFVSDSQSGESWAIVRYGENGKNSIKVSGQDKEKYIRQIIDLHNDPKNAINLQGDNVFKADEFQGKDLQTVRSILEQKKTKFGSDNQVIAARRDTVDIPVKLDAVPRGDRPGTYAAFNLDDDTRISLRDKGFTLLSEPRSEKNGRIQKLRLHRDGFVYTITLTNNENNEGVTATVKAESVYNLATGGKGKFSFEGGVAGQVLRAVDTDAVTNVSTPRDVKYAVTLSPTLRPGFIEINRTRTAEGTEKFEFDPRNVLKNRIEAAKGKVERVGERNITYTSGGQTTRLDITADGRVLVSRDGRFVGDYDFVAGDIGGGVERAILRSSKIEGEQLFRVVDIPEELQFDGRVTFVYRDSASGAKAGREYFAIKNDGSVHFIPPTEMNYVDKLLRLQYIQNLNDAREVFGHQLIEFYAEPVRDANGIVVGYADTTFEKNVYDANLTSQSTKRFTAEDVNGVWQVTNFFGLEYQPDFVKVWAIIAPNGDVVRATTEEGIDAFIEDIRNYANIIDDSEWNPSSRRESIFGEAYNEQGRYTERDLYGTMYEAPLYGEGITDEEFNKDSDVIRKATREVVDQIKRDITSLRKLSRKIGSLISKDRIDQFEFLAADLGQNLKFYDTLGDGSSQSVSSYLNNSPREFNEAVRRRLYRVRTAQAMLHIDLYRNRLSGTIDRNKLNDILLKDVGDYNSSDTIEQLRQRAIQAESIAVRLEEAYVDRVRAEKPTSTKNLLWEAIYPDSSEGKYGSFVDRIHSEGTDFRFSRAQQIPRIQRKTNLLDELNDAIGSFSLNEMLEKGLRNESGGLRILPTQEAAHDIERMFTTDATQPYYDDEGLIQGFVAPDGIMYLVEDGIRDGKARQIILHEYGVHARKFGMTDAQFQEVVQSIKGMRDEKSLEGDFVRHCITRAKQANRNMSEDNPIFWEEVAAYAVEDGYHLADTGIVGRMQTWMKNWLWRFGVIDASAFHYQDFVNMAQGMLGNPGPLSFFDGTHDYTKYQDTWKNIPKFSRTILAEDTPEREEFAQRTYRRLRGLDDAIERERNGESADTIEQATDWRRNDNGNWGIRYSRINVEGARRLDISDPRGLTTRMMEYDLAVQMEAEGRSEAEIKALTNWTRGNDGLWGYEVVDKDMTFEIPGLPPLEEELATLEVPEGELKQYYRKYLEDQVKEKYFPGSGENFSAKYILSSFDSHLSDYRIVKNLSPSERVKINQMRKEGVRNPLIYSGIRSDFPAVLQFKRQLLRHILERIGEVGRVYTNWVNGEESEIEERKRGGEFIPSYKADSQTRREFEDLISMLEDESLGGLTEEQHVARIEQEVQRIEAALSERISLQSRDNYKIFNDLATGKLNEELSRFVNSRVKQIESLKERIKSLKRGHQGKLSNVVSHPELFHAYPELEDVQLEFKVMFPGIAGYMEETTREGASKRHFRIVINSLLDTEQMKSTALHEMQHVIQALSGFASGGNTAMFRDADLLRRTRYLKLQGRVEDLQMKRVLSKIVTRDNVLDFVTSDLYENELLNSGKFARFSDEFYIKGQAVNGVGQFVDVLLNNQFAPSLNDHLGGTFYNYLKETHPELLKEVEREYNEAQQRKLKADNEYRELTDEPYQKYRRLMGELEARVTQRRMNMTEEEMRETPISETEREFEGIEKEELIDPRDLKEVVNGEPGTESELRYSRATAEDLKSYKSFINDLEDNLVRERISGVPREGDTVLYQRGDVNEFITRDSLYTVEDAADYHPDLEQRWIDYHRDDSESNFVRYSRSISETNGFRYSFAGEIGAAALDAYEEVTTHMDNLAIAREMEEAGKDAKAIKYATGWERGADSKWRYEIDDSANRVDLTVADNGPARLADVLDAPELFRAYPQLKNVKVEFDEDFDLGEASYYEDDNRIALGGKPGDDNAALRSTLHHEVQHAVQQIEGFAPGGNTLTSDSLEYQKILKEKREEITKRKNAVERFIRDAFDETLFRDFLASVGVFVEENGHLVATSSAGENFLLQNINSPTARNLAYFKAATLWDGHSPKGSLREQIGTELYDFMVGSEAYGNRLQDLNREYDSLLAKVEEARNEYRVYDADGSTYQRYRRLAGEVEARNVERRLSMTMEQRRASFASETEDVAREDQIILENMLNEASSAIRFSRAATIDDVPQTPRQRGTQVPNAPGMYKMPDGSLHIEPSELPVGFESKTILYAAIAVSDPAKEEPKIAELRGLILTDPDLMREIDRMMRERNDTNEDHRLGYAVSLILEAYDPASDIYQQTVDAFHEAVSKATGGAYQNLVLDTGQIEAAAHAAAGIPYEPLLTAPQETVPTPRPNTADMEHLRRQEMFAASDAQRAEMQIGEDGRAYISTGDSDVDVVFESKVNTPFDTGRLTDDVLIGASRQGEDDDFYNHLADSPHHGTQEPLDTGRFARPADQYKQEVQSYLANVLPEHIWRRVEILWEDTPENNAILGNALGLFKSRSWKNKNIFIKGWNRSFGQVVRTAAREASRFGWGMWQNRDFRKAITDFYDMFHARIYEELRPYYNQRGLTDPTRLSNNEKIFMVQTFFSKMNQSLFTDDQGNMGDVLGISQTEYNRILAEVRSGVAAQERDLSAFVQGVAGDTELAKQFAAEMLRMTMEAATKMGVHFTYERNSRLGGKDRIRVFTNEWGTYRRTVANTRFGKAAEEIKKNLRWWRERFNMGEGGEKFARWAMRNLPMSMRYPLEWMHLYVPHARLGDTTLGRASQMISRVWQRIGDTSGTTLTRDYALMEDIHGILRAHNYDPLMADDMGNKTYREFFEGLGITSEKDLKKADMADAVVSTAERLKMEGEARIRQTIMETGVSLWNRMLNAGVSQRDVQNMVNRFEGYRQRFMLDHYSHRMYEAFTPEGKRELSILLNYLRRDPATGEHTLAKRAKEARDAIARAQARYGAATSEFYRETKQARDDLRRWERLQHLWNCEMGHAATKYKGLIGAELNAKVVEGMERYILSIVSETKTHGRFDPQAVPHYNAISAQKARRLDPNVPLDKELMDFLLEIKDPMRNAVYTLDQQRQIIAKLEFNKELGEYLLDNNMADLRGQPDADGLARDLAHMEAGSFLEYVNVDPDFMPEIKAEWENMQKVADTVLGGVTDAVKANSTVYSLRLAMNNYIGNASMLVASGHLWRIGNWHKAGEVVWKQFVDRFTYGAKDPSDYAKMIIKEMEDNMVFGGSGTEMTAFQLNKGAHEKMVRMLTQALVQVSPLTKRGKFKVDNFVARMLEKARAFYTYGDEWVKPLIYLNNRANAVAKYEALEKRYDGETEEDYRARVLKKAIEEASEQTIRETVSWENSPFMVRQLSTKSVRFFVPDFLLHNFQMLRITASNYVRLANIIQELRNFDPSQMNPGTAEAYRSALLKEFAQRGVGGAMTAGVYAGLAGATGSCMAFIPYMMNTLMAAIDGEDDKDKDNTFFNPQEWEGAQRILNYKTGGDNFFVPAWKHNGKIYAWNYGRASVMLTHAIPQPATENPEFTDYAAQFFKNIVNIGGGTIAQEIVNNFQGKDKWGRDIGMEAGWWKIIDRVLVPGAARQLIDMSIGYPGSENPYREGKAIKMSDAVGITVNAYDMRDIVNELGWDMGRVGSNSQNVVRKSFVKRLTRSDALSDSDVASMVSDMREDNARQMNRANFLLTGLRQMGMENKELQHWLTTSRKDAGNVLSKKQATAFLKGHNIYDEALVTYLKNKRNNLAKGKDDVRMSGEELATVLQNYDKAIRIYSQALRAN